jgi:hypothetical protein
LALPVLSDAARARGRAGCFADAAALAPLLKVSDCFLGTVNVSWGARHAAPRLMIDEEQRQAGGRHLRGLYSSAKCPADSSA